MATTQKDVYDNLVAIDPDYMSYEKFQEKMKNPKHVESIRNYLNSVNVPVSDSTRFFEKYSTPVPSEQDNAILTKAIIGKNQNVKPNEPYTPNEFERIVTPRLAQTNPNTVTPKQELTSLGLDLLSLPGRYASSFGRTGRQTISDLYNNENPVDVALKTPGRFVENVGLIEAPNEPGIFNKVTNFAGDIARNPATIIPGPGRIGGVVSKIAPELTLAARETVPAVVQGLGRMLAEGGTQVAIGEANRLSQGKDFGEGSPVDYALEGGVGTALGIVPGLRSWTKESAEKSAGKGINYMDIIHGNVPSSPERAALGARDVLERFMSHQAPDGSGKIISYYNPEKSIVDNAKMFRDLIEFNPNFKSLKNSDAVNQFMAGIENQIPKTGSDFVPLLAANIVKNVPYVGKPAAGAIVASQAIQPFSHVPTTAGASSLGRGLGSTLLNQLTPPVQDQVSRFNKFVGRDSTKQ